MNCPHAGRRAFKFSARDVEVAAVKVVTHRDHGKKQNGQTHQSSDRDKTLAPFGQGESARSTGNRDESGYSHPYEIKRKLHG